MKWPEFNGEVGIAAPDGIYTLVLQEKLYKPMLKSSALVNLLKLDKNELIPEDGFMFLPAWLNFFVTEKFIREHFAINSDGYVDFCRELEVVLTMFSSIFQGTERQSLRSPMFCFYYQYQSNIFQFQLQNNTIENLLAGVQKLFEFLSNLISKNNRGLDELIEKTFATAEKVNYFYLEDNDWTSLDPLEKIASGINLNYKENTDQRVNKPDIILQEDNLNRKYTFGDDWILSFDGLDTLMTRPNDVSIYASICEKNLLEAKKFYEQNIVPRHQYYTGNFPSKEQQKEYYDYFELITTALIFSFTAVEALVNTIIPESYQFIKNGGKVHNKEYIERYYKLTDKLTLILSEILSTPDPKEEDWWSDMAVVQKLRNESIHTKQSFSEERYSKLLEQDIFRLIGVYKVIISYYGRFIKLNAPGLLNSYPYNFGYDEVNPSLMSDRAYRDIYNDLHNPTNPL